MQFQKIKRLPDPNDKFAKDVHNIKCCEPTLDLRQIALNKLPATILLRFAQRIECTEELKEKESFPCRHFVKVKNSYDEINDIPPEPTKPTKESFKRLSMDASKRISKVMSNRKSRDISVETSKDTTFNSETKICPNASNNGFLCEAANE